MTTVVARRRAPALPAARGPLSEALIGRLRTGSGRLPAGAADPFGEDLQLALYLCYELHYRGFDSVDDADEWAPDLLTFRRSLEEPYVEALRDRVEGGDDLNAAIDALLVEPCGETGVSHHLRRDGELWQLREYVVHRSLYHLKEADPQAWVIPRLDGPAKAGLVTVTHDEYGGGRPEAMHSRLYADLMRSLDLADDYGRYLDVVPAATLAEVTAMSLFGLHRAYRGALVGQFALVELTSSPGSARMVRATERLHCAAAATRFYAEHVEADAVHEQIIRRQVLAPLLAAEPELRADVVFGIQAASALAADWEEAVLGAWSAGLSSLRTSL